MEVLVRKVIKDAIIPEYAKPGDSGFDFVLLEDVTIPAGAVVMVPTGLAFAIPEGYELQLRMRSGAAGKTPLILPNAPGTVDAGYRGEVCYLLRNTGGYDFTVPKGTRLVQGVVAPVVRATLTEVDTLPSSERGTGGFGSTGTAV